MNDRRAISLVELLLTMSACVVILTMSTGLIHRMLLAQSKSRAFVDGERVSLRLAHQFRSDIHEAIKAAMEKDRLNEAVLLSLTLPDNHTVEYHRTPAAVSRVLLENGSVRSREEFVFPASIEVSVEQPRPSLVRLSITSQPERPLAGATPQWQPAYDATVGVQTDAVLNRHATATTASDSQGGAP